MIFYIIPTIIAFYRNHPNRWLIFVITFVIGGTGMDGSARWFGRVPPGIARTIQTARMAVNLG